jgi:hypothetical protein
MELKSIDDSELEKQHKFEVYNKTQIEAWLKAHPQGPKPPIYWDESLNCFRWLSRQERRKGLKIVDKPKVTLVDQHGRELSHKDEQASRD